MPGSCGKTMWDICILVVLLYTALYAPYRTAFHSGDSSPALLYFETFVDIVFISDIFVTFFTPYERSDGSLEFRHKKIARNYVFGGLLIDIVASLPT